MVYRKTFTQCFDQVDDGHPMLLRSITYHSQIILRHRPDEGAKIE
jgi:hypothetical protein